MRSWDSDVVMASWLPTAHGGRFVQGVVEPAFEFLQPVVDLAQDALDGGDRRVANRGGVKKKDESGQVTRDQYQLVDVFNSDRDQCCRRSSGIVVTVWFSSEDIEILSFCCLWVCGNGGGRALRRMSRWLGSATYSKI